MPRDQNGRAALIVAGLIFGMAAEWAGKTAGGAAAVVADLAVGVTFIVLGVELAATSQRTRRVGWLMTATGVAWFVGGVAHPLVFLHRGPLIHLLVVYPTGLVRAWVQRAVVVLAYGDAVFLGIGSNAAATLGLAVIAVGTLGLGFLGSQGIERRARATSWVAGTGVLAALSAGAVARLAGVTETPIVLWGYSAALIAAALALYTTARGGYLEEAVVAGLVVDLGDAGTRGSLRDKLAEVLGDPSVLIGYRLEGSDGYVNEAGGPVVLPEPGSGRTVIPLEADGQPVGMLIHDASAVDDSRLVGEIAALARLALTNVRLQSGIQRRVSDLAASRARIVAAEDAERARLARDLHVGVQGRLDRVAQLLVQGSVTPGILGDLEKAQAQLNEFIRGVHPRILAEGGIGPALAELTHGSPLDVELHVVEQRFPRGVELTAYYVCSEGLANAAKHSGASRILVRVDLIDRLVKVEVTDDGAGGADPSRGAGIRGLADRVQAAGGSLSVMSPRGAGTRLVAELPLPRPFLNR